MVGAGREDKKDNDLFYVCSLIEYIARKTKNVRTVVVNSLGKERLEKIYDLADVYHCDNIDHVCDELIEEASIEVGDFVIVPAGKDNHEAVVEVVNIEYFNDENAPLPAEKTKRIIRKRTDDDFDPPVE